MLGQKFESGMVVNPLTINPNASLADALALMKQHGISGFPVVENGANPGRLVGILTNRDVRFASDPSQKVAELMTHDGLVTVREPVGQDEAKRLLHHHRIEKLLVVDEDYRCVGLITVKDMEKAQLNPHATKDEHGRLRVAAASSVGDSGFERSERLIDAEVDLVVIDTAHGHSQRVLEAVRRVKKLSNRVEVIAGNVATTDGARALIDAGADAVKVGIGPGSICTTRIVAGVGVPQLTAIMDTAKAAADSGVPVIADGGIKFSGDLAKALAAGASSADGTACGGDARPAFLERFIHGEIYRARPDVMSVVHSHSPTVIPFGLVATPMQAMFHNAAFLAEGVPVFDVARKFGATDMLVGNREKGEELARVIGPSPVVLMRAHGCVVVGPNLRTAVFRAVYTEVSARIQHQATALGGPIAALTREEGLLADAINLKAAERAWELWAKRVGR